MDFGDFEIPILEWPSNAGGYGAIPIDLDDIRSNDPLISLAGLGVASQSYYARTDGGNSPYGQQIPGSLPNVWCRSLVAQRLMKANDLLQPQGAEVFVLDGYRPIPTQVGLWTFYLDRSLSDLPAASDEQRRAYVLNYVSDPMRFDPNDPTTWPAHSTGGAVDLTLRNVHTRELLDMGASFDEMDEISHSDACERAFRDGKLADNERALRNRRLLHWAMEGVGLVNYPLEYWHFDWGNQMYVHNLKIAGRAAPEAAWYGYVEPPN